ncbi:MAG: auxin-responsive-like protein [Phycisphaerales bacterium]|nr:auxin-responsive-like protein [Phycisphaerales bacterium]
MVKAALANSAWWMASGPSFAAFSSALDDPARAQAGILRSYLRTNAGTAFGREHGFADLRTPEQFARRVPARDYDEFNPWIERIRRGEHGVLTAAPVQRLVPTGGSTAPRKLIPYTRAMQRELNCAIGPWIFDLFCKHPRAALGPSYWSISPLAGEDSGREVSAVPVGFDDDAAQLGGWRRHAVTAVMAVRGELRNITSVDVWRYVTLLLLLRRADLSLISVWHPSFLELLLDALRRDFHRLVGDVASGQCSVIAHLPPSVAPLTLARPDVSRAGEIEGAGIDNILGIWPKLAVLSCWAHGHAAPAVAALARTLPGVTVQPKGLLATEGVVSIPFARQHPLAVRSHFFEFVDEAGRVALAPDLEVGHTYGVLLTTAGGLCRYRLHDLIQVDGMAGRTPSIRFVGRSAHMSDRMGEKLTDGFVALVLEQLFARHAPRPSFTMLAPDIDAAGCRYTLYMNADLPTDAIASLDQLLAANPQYAWCRRLRQLHPPRAFRVAGNAYAAYSQRLCAGGQRLGDIKPAALSALDGWSIRFPGAYLDSHPD